MERARRALKWVKRKAIGAARPTGGQARRVLEEWNRHAERYRTPEYVGNQALIEPYVMQRRQNGVDLNFLVANGEGRAWWDQLAFDVGMEMISQLKMIPPGGVVFDLGANTGFYTILFSRMAGPGGKVYAFDPFPLNADIVRFNGILNGADIEVFPVGLAKERKKVRAAVSSQIVAVGGGADSEIQLDRLDSYAHLKPDFVKIDIEGAEVDCLEGASKVLASRPNIYVEVHPNYLPHFGRRAEEIFDLVPWRDYLCYIQHPGKPFARYKREFEITAGCALYFVKEEPIQRVFLRAAA